MTPPPATISGRCAERSTDTARANASGSGTGRGTCHTRGANSSSGQSYAWACTSCGSAMVTAPVSAGSVSTRAAPSSAAGSCSGRHTRSKNRDTGRNTSLTLTSPNRGSSSSCNTGLATRVAKTSPGNRSTGSRFTVASAAPVTMLVAPGPIEVVQARVDNRLRIRANPAAACTIPCSLRPWRYGTEPPASSASSSAWPIPATLPCPKMPKQPSISRCRTPSRSVRCAARKRTTAWPTVSLMGPAPFRVARPGNPGTPSAAGDRPAGPARYRGSTRGPGRH